MKSVTFEIGVLGYDRALVYGLTVDWIADNIFFGSTFLLLLAHSAFHECTFLKLRVGCSRRGNLATTVLIFSIVSAAFSVDSLKHIN